MRRSRPKPVPEEGIAIRVVVLVAVMASAWAALDETATGTTLHVVVLVGLPLGFAYSYLTRRRTGWVLKTLLTVGLLLAFAQFLRAVGQLQGESVSDVQTPLAELFIWVQLLHAFDVPGRRDLGFSLASSAVLAAIAGVLSVSLVVAPFFVVWAVASIAGLALAHRSSLADLPCLAPTETGRRGRRADLGWMRPVAATIAAVVVLGAGLFMVVPTAGTARALAFPASLPRLIAVPNAGGLVNPSLGPEGGGSDDGSSGGDGGESFGYFGFAPTLDTSVRGRPDDTLVMRVRASSPDIWRAQTFDRFDGRVWSRTDDKPEPVRSRSPFSFQRVALDGPRPADTSELVQTYYLEETGPNVLFAANTPSQLYFSDRIVFQLPDGSLRAGVQLERDATYTVISNRPDATAETLRASAADRAGIPHEIVERYTQAGDVPPRVRDLAALVTRDSATPYDAVRALERWMGHNTEYTLDAPRPPRGANAVEQFLFVDREGFCEQIATSLVVMLRSLGIPARLAVGYLPGERNPFTGLYEVRADDAHAWAEVYFPGVGWQGFDPTAPVPLAGDTSGAAAGAGALAYLAARLPAVPAWLPEGGVAALFLVGGATIVRALARRRARRRAGRARPWGAVQLERFEAIGAARGRPRRPSETVPEFADALDDPVLDRAARVIERELYSGRSVTPDDRAIVETALTSATTG
ncbi:MAG: transglutaminase TgpA family protein [Acidimicrobiia bacterium]